MTITTGSLYQFASAADVGENDFNVLELSSTSFAIVYRQETTNEHFIVVGTISGTAITFGPNSSLGTTSSTKRIAAAALSSSLVIVTRVDTTGGNSKVTTVSISGTICTVNTDVVLDAATTLNEFSICKLDLTTALAVYNKTGTGLVAVVITVSGTTPTVNTPVTLNATESDANSVVSLSSTATILAYIDGTTSYPSAQAISISGTTPTASTAITVESAAAFSTSTQKFCVSVDSTTAVMCWLDFARNDLRSSVLKNVGSLVAGSVISIATPIDFANGRHASLCSTSANQLVYNYTNSTTFINNTIGAYLSGTTITPSIFTAVTFDVRFTASIGSVGTAFVVAVSQFDAVQDTLEAFVGNSTAPPPPPLEFYTGNGSLTYRSDMNISGILPGALLVRANGTVVAATNDNTDSVVVETATDADTFAGWTDITGVHPTSGVVQLIEL